MSNLKQALTAIAMWALASQTMVLAQVRQPMLLRTPEIPQQPANQPIQKPMFLPGTMLRVNPIKIYNMLKRPYIATTAEGHIVYLYDDNVLTEERIIGSDTVGKYTYGRTGRFERLDYSDGISIAASYGDAGELVKLTSSNGRSIGFNYHRNSGGAIRPVTPMENALEFHSAVALLRLKRQPVWWSPPATPMENLKDNEGKNGKTTSPDNPDNPWGAPEYPYDPFLNAPKSPDGTPVIEVDGSPEPPDTDPGLSPLPTPPVHDGGVDVTSVLEKIGTLLLPLRKRV